MSPTLADAESALSRWFGFSSLRAPQRRAIVAVLAGRDTLVVMPTGGGKSLCFQIPALIAEGLTVVLSPLVSLMKDQVDALERRCIPAVGLHGGMSPGEQADALGRALRGEVKMLYVAPERLIAGRTRSALARARIALLAIDEAHCISEWGHDFRPAYRELQRIREPLGSPPAIALTATATPDVREDIVQVCGLRRPVRIVAGFDRPNLRYSVRRVGRVRDRDRKLVELAGHARGTVVVYAQTRNRVERIAATLRGAGIRAVAYHAGQPPALRRANQESFMRGELRAIAATSAFGMGVDKADVRLVIHDAIAPSLESYYQEAGRAGRDGAPADCVLLYARADRRSPQYFIDAASPLRATIEATYAAASAIARAQPTGHVAWVDRPAVAARIRRSPSEVAGALAILAKAGAVLSEEGDRGCAWVRLIATDHRINSHLRADPLRLDLVRELWRQSGGGVRAGAVVQFGALPPGLGGPGIVDVLDALMRDSILVWERTHAGLRMVNPMSPLTRWDVDWTAIAVRRRVAEARLAAMIGYAETRGCRRRVLLGYFGEDARPVRCGACDRCA
jgi:ATP-dependent DNA helicase RecQ